MTIEHISSGLSDVVVDKLQRAFSRHENIDSVIMYGSRALGTFRTGSDIDLTLIGNHLKLDDLLKIEAELDDLMTPYSFDLSVFNQIDNLKLIEHIERVGVVFYSKVANSVRC
jgi:predicted nucleotidyltransferase